MDKAKRKFLAGLVADLGKVLIGTGAITQIFSKSPNWFVIFIVSTVAIIVFIVAFFVYPKE